jgi:hypothetical protein
MNLYPVTVVDNFYDNPDAMRKFALAQKYKFRHEETGIDYVYPGCRTKDIYELDSALQAKVLKKIISVFVGAAYGSGIIHTDTNTIFAGVLYLSPDAPLDAGTSLFKKNASFDQAKYKQAQDVNEERFNSGELMMDTSYHYMFDEVLRLNNVYNTLILFEGEMFHAANQFFGSTLEDSRLVQVFFINKIDANKVNSFPINRIKEIKL